MIIIGLSSHYLLAVGVRSVNLNLYPIYYARSDWSVEFGPLKFAAVVVAKIPRDLPAVKLMKFPHFLTQLKPSSWLLSITFFSSPSILHFSLLLHDWEHCFIVIGLEQANLSFFFLICPAMQINTARSLFSQSYNRWVIVWKLEKSRNCTTPLVIFENSFKSLSSIKKLNP